MRVKRRRAEGKTDYKKRLALLKSGKARVVFRRTNKYIYGQYVKSREAKDYVIIGANSKELLKYGWLVAAQGSLKSISASYLTGFLLGKKILEKEGESKEVIFDIGLRKSIAKSRVYSFLKGIVEAGINISYKEELFPEEGKIRGGHLKIKLEFDKIRKNIENKFLGKIKEG